MNIKLFLKYDRIHPLKMSQMNKKNKLTFKSLSSNVIHTSRLVILSWLHDDMRCILHSRCQPVVFCILNASCKWQRMHMNFTLKILSDIRVQSNLMVYTSCIMRHMNIIKWWMKYNQNLPKYCKNIYELVHINSVVQCQVHFVKQIKWK